MTTRKAVGRIVGKAGSVTTRVERETWLAVDRSGAVPRDAWGCRIYTVPHSGFRVLLGLFHGRGDVVGSAVHRASCVRLGGPDR